MKSQFAVRVLAALGMLALSTGLAQAGDGGKPSPLTSFFVCHSINGSSANKTVDLQSPVFGPDRQSVKIGNGTLACAWAKLFTSGNSGAPAEEVVPNPEGTLEQLKCYSVAVARKTSGPGAYNVTDALFASVLGTAGTVGSQFPLGTDFGVQATELRIICGPANYFR